MLGNVVLFGISIGIADAEIVLGPMAGAVDTLAVWLSAPDIAFDEGTAEQTRIERGDPLEKGGPSFSQRRGGLRG
jgi:hypothetical protein